jgi:cyanophycinase-like exopeptidase
VLLGIEEMTALVRLSGSTEWRVMGAGAVHVLQGAPQGQYEPGEVVPIS